MDEVIKVKCPCCTSELVIRRRDGVLLECREPLLDESSGDRFEDAFEKVRRRSGEAKRKVEEARRKERERMEGADDFFKEALRRARETEGERPENPLDYD